MSSSRWQWPDRLPAVVTAAAVCITTAPAPARVLEFVQTAEGSRLANARSVAVSPDGRHLYVGAEGLNVFARDAASGELRPVEREEVGEHRVTVSPDGRHVYAIATGYKFSDLHIYERDAASGRLSPAGVADLTFLDPSSLAISPDGRHLYAIGGGALVTLERDAATGTLREVARLALTDPLRAVQQLVPAPDGRQLYAVVGVGVAVLRRDLTSGVLDLVAHYGDETGFEGMGSARLVTLGPDGRHLYVATRRFADPIGVFAREATTGRLSFVEAFDAPGLGGQETAAVSPDGRRVYMAGGDRLTALARDPDSGGLSLEAVYDGEGRTFFADLAVSPESRFVYLADFSSGRVFGVAAALEDGALTAAIYASGEPGFAGLGGAYAAAASPGGEHVYVASQSDHAVTATARNPATGELEPLASYFDAGSVRGLIYANSVTPSPDGRNVYVTSSLRFNPTGALAVFERHPVTGLLSFLEAHEEGLTNASSAAFSPDGRYLYVGGSEHIVTFVRGTGPGGLERLAETPFGGGTFETVAVAMSPDGGHLYATSSGRDEVAAFARDAAGGGLELAVRYSLFRSGIDGLDGAGDLAVSPDGRHVYVAGSLDSAVVVFARDDADGTLEHVATYFDDAGGVDGIGGAASVAVDPAGDFVYVAGSVDSSLAVFARDDASGRLDLLEVHTDGVDGVDGLGRPVTVSVSPDGRFVDLASREESAVAVFRRKSGPCVDGPGAPCLGANRFRVEVDWRDHRGNAGTGMAAPQGSEDSGLFWFFGPDNWELLVKVIDGCRLNQRHWVFAAATTDVEYTLTVTDVLAGVTRRYGNPLGRASSAVTDTDAFATCDLTQAGSPGVSSLASGSFTPAPDATAAAAGFDARPVRPKTSSDGLLVGLGGKCLDVAGGGAADGTPVKLFRCHGKPNQRWRLDPTDAGFEIQGLEGKCLGAGEEIDAGRTEAVLGPCGEDALWELDHDYTVASRFLHLATGRCLDVEGGRTDDRTPVQLFDCHGGANQTWRWEGISCRGGLFEACLNRGRFRVEVFWRDPNGHTGRGRAVPFGAVDSGLFWFFREENWELLVKVLDGCALNEHYWVFAAATTDVQVTLRVTDTRDGLVREYLNPLGRAADAITDTQAFATCP